MMNSDMDPADFFKENRPKKVAELTDLNEDSGQKETPTPSKLPEEAPQLRN